VRVCARTRAHSSSCAALVVSSPEKLRVQGNNQASHCLEVHLHPWDCKGSLALALSLARARALSLSHLFTFLSMPSCSCATVLPDHTCAHKYTQHARTQGHTYERAYSFPLPYLFSLSLSLFHAAGKSAVSTHTRPPLSFSNRRSSSGERGGGGGDMSPPPLPLSPPHPPSSSPPPPPPAPSSLLENASQDKPDVKAKAGGVQAQKKEVEAGGGQDAERDGRSVQRGESIQRLSSGEEGSNDAGMHVYCRYPYRRIHPRYA
jgi:hypothetical protein